MNMTILQGNLTHDPVLKYVEGTNKKVAVCNFSIAVNRHFRKANGEKQKETTFVDCEVWDSAAETIYKYVKKGERFLIWGALKNDSWENKDGQKVTKLRVRVEGFDLPVRSRRDDTVPKSTDTMNASVSPTSPELTAPTEPANGDDIPF